MSAFGNAIKDIARNTLLYDSTKVCKGKNSYGNINARGSSLSYILGATSSILISFLGGLLLEFYTTSTSYLIIGIVGLIVILLVLMYMKKRIGLSPQKYNKEDKCS